MKKSKLETRIENIEKTLGQLVAVLSGTERSEALQGCPPSANCSAGARADARPDSLIGSPVPRETAVRQEQLIEPMISRARAAREMGLCTRTIKRWEALYGLTPVQLTSRTILYKVSDFKAAVEKQKGNHINKFLPDARQCNGERALARNAELSDSARNTTEIYGK